jgi:hypothetical protein
MHARNDFATQCADFVIEGARFMSMNQEIEAEGIPIDAAQNMHQPSFDTASVHPPHNMKNLHW